MQSLHGLTVDEIRSKVEAEELDYGLATVALGKELREEAIKRKAEVAGSLNGPATPVP